MITYSKNPLSSNCLLSGIHTGNDTALRNSPDI